VQFLRKDGRDDLEVLVWLLTAHGLNDCLAMNPKVFVHSLDEGLAKLVARALRPTIWIANLARLNWLEIGVLRARIGHYFYKLDEMWGSDGATAGTAI